MYELYFNYPTILVITIASISDRPVMCYAFFNLFLRIFVPFEQVYEAFDKGDDLESP